ncbi:MAG: hypothetical protein GC206_04920 [Alphaproteobacteria bacterium]|nr:hypothetical protein [Alphaproteobacteria bacterium]
MNLLVALLAFAGLMAFLSTAVSILIEGVHKAFALRRAGLEEALRTLHDDVLAKLADGDAARPAAGDATRTSADAGRFARNMTESVSFGGKGRFWWLRNLPILSWFFTRKKHKLTTLQFIEGFARSETGARLKALGFPNLRRALTIAAYEFERYTDAQSEYFRRRAQVLSVMAAMVFAFAANIDAFYIFHRLATTPQISAAIERIAVNQEQRAVEGDGADRARAMVAQAQEFADSGLPIGYMAYPYCLENAVLIVAQDPRCPRINRAAGAEVPPNPPFSEILSNAGARVSAPGGGGFLWFISVLVAGGLIGLGAPFWYDVFRRIARIVPAARSVHGVLGNRDAQAPPAAGPEVVRDGGAANPNALVIAYRVAGGQAAEAAASASIDLPLDPLTDAAPDSAPGGAGASDVRFRRPL